jgi:hypothetical protein
MDTVNLPGTPVPDPPEPWTPEDSAAPGTWKFDPHTGKPLSSAAREKDGETPSGDFTHYVHLHDGRVIRHDIALMAHRLVGSLYTEGEIDDDGTDNRTISQVIGVYPR